MSRVRKYHPFLVKLKNWEYWPATITNIPVVFFWLWQSIRARDLLFFTAINPAIETGGLFGESKRGINALMESSYLPTTAYFPATSPASVVIEQMQQNDLSFPVILKPDVGERGFNVSVIHNTDQLTSYLNGAKGQLILQEYIDYPLEFSILCYDFPTSRNYGITSVCQKEFLTVTGDGSSTLRQLIMRKPRALLQRQKLFNRQDIDDVPAKDNRVQLEPIGNHCRGTKFLNANDLIDADLTNVMISMLRRMDGVQFGRFDLRARSVEDLRRGKHFKVLEFNGAGSEPAHIYDPEYSITSAYGDLWKQWDLMRRIAKEQKQLGVRTTSLHSTIRALRNHLEYKRNARLADATP